MKIKTAYFEITNRCNLNCITCYNRSGVNRKLKEITKQQLEDSIKLLQQYGLQRLLISGGEPTLHTQFEKILDLIDEYPNISFGIVTNGTNHNTKLIDMLNTRNNLTLQISIDGSNEEQNSKTRGNGNFAKAIDFAKQIHNSNINPLLKMVLSQNNYDDIESFYQLALSVNFIPEFAFIYKSGNGSDNWDNKCLSAQQKLKALKLINALNKKYNTTAFLPFCTSKCPFVEKKEPLSICIKVDGSIQPCQSIYDSAYTLGNIFDFEVSSFTNKLEHIYTLAKNHHETDYNCTKCIIKEGCGKGCMAMSINLNGDPLSNDGDCEFRKLQFLGYKMAEALSKK